METKYTKTIKLLFIPAILFAVFFVFGNEAKAADYYVSPSGSDSSSGLIGAPFKTIQKAANIVNPGDTVIVKDGIYADTDNDNFVVILRRGGTASNWVTFKSETKWGAKIRCANSKLEAEGGDMGFVFSDTSNYIRIEDFEALYCSSGFWSNWESEYLYFYRNHSHDNRTGFFQGEGTTYHTYDSNLIHDNGRTSAENPNGAHDHGIYAYGSNNTIINNIFYNHNWGWDIQLSGGCSATDGPNWLISNNVFDTYNTQSDVQYGQIIIWTRACTAPATPKHPTNITIQNNIFYHPVGNYAIRADWEGGNSSWNIKNNLIYGAAHLMFGQIPVTYNESGTQYTDPLFVDRDGRDYHLQATSPAINAGLATNAPLVDIDGTARPQGSAVDIGAYEYVGTQSDTTPPAAPSGLTVQ